MVVEGAHVSVAGGLANGPVNGAAIGCRAIQIFSKNQRQWRAKPLSEQEAAAFRQAMADNGLKAMVIHDSYLINLASPKPEMLEKSRLAFVDEMERAEALGSQGLVFHPGAHQDAGEAAGIETIAASLDWCVERAGGTTPLLLETTAGQGSSVGYRFEHLAGIMAACGKAARKRLGVCFDTCHTFAAGYDFTNPEGYAETFNEFDSLIGLDKLKAFHLNDSKQPFGSRRDRHDGLGLGAMGEEPFRLLINDARFAEVPALLEVPGGNEAYSRDLALLCRLREA